MASANVGAVAVAGSSSMTAPASRFVSCSAMEALSHPAFGAHTNGLPACAWVPLIDVRDERFASLLLGAFRDRGVPGCALRLRRADSPPLMRVWTDATAWTTAQDIVRRVVAMCSDDKVVTT